MGFYTRKNVQQTAHATFQTFLVTHFMSSHVNFGTQHTGVEIRAETTSWEKWPLHNQDWRPWLRIHQCRKGSSNIPGKIPIHIVHWFRLWLLTKDFLGLNSFDCNLLSSNSMNYSTIYCGKARMTSPISLS